jgi:hypothetical protein
VIYSQKGEARGSSSSEFTSNVHKRLHDDKPIEDQLKESNLKPVEPVKSFQSMLSGSQISKSDNKDASGSENWKDKLNKLGTIKPEDSVSQIGKHETEDEQGHSQLASSPIMPVMDSSIPYDHDHDDLEKDHDNHMSQWLENQRDNLNHDDYDLVTQPHSMNQDDTGTSSSLDSRSIFDHLNSHRFGRASGKLSSGARPLQSWKSSQCKCYNHIGC